MMRISVTAIGVLVVALLAVSAEAGQLSDSSRASPGEHPTMLAKPFFAGGWLLQMLTCQRP
jgi:hypothetical protein